MMIDEAVSGLDDVTAEARATFGSLTIGQLNWKPAPNSWSVAQCLDHLIAINRLYFPLFESLKAGSPQPTSWERFSPFSGMFGRIMIKVLDPSYKRKSKTSRKAEPAESVIDPGIIDRFARHQAELAAYLRGIAPGVDRTRTIVTSPLAGFVTYSLDDTIAIIVVHEKRHLEQAKRVMRANGFPESTTP